MRLRQTATRRNDEDFKINIYADYLLVTGAQQIIIGDSSKQTHCEAHIIEGAFLLIKLFIAVNDHKYHKCEDYGFCQLHIQILQGIHLPFIQRGLSFGFRITDDVAKQ